MTKTAACASAFVLAVVSAMSACTPDCEEKVEVVDMTAWRLLSTDEDPFTPPPDAVLCSAENIRMEPFGNGPVAVDIDTATACGWATVEQPTTEDLTAGDEVQLRIFYFSQTSFPQDVAEVIIAFDGEPFFSVEVPIPTSSQLEAPLIVVDRDIPTGTPVQFHVGNHGDNSWNLLEVSRTRKVFCSAS